MVYLKPLEIWVVFKVLRMVGHDFKIISSISNQGIKRSLHSAGMTRPYARRAKFEPREDGILTATVHARGTSNWSDVAAALPGRTARQCRERWNNYVNPNLNTGPWTSSEDSFLLQKYQELGRKWHLIAGFFNGRARNEIRNRFLILHRKKPRTPPCASAHPRSGASLSSSLDEENHDSSDSAKVPFSWETASDFDRMASDFPF
jgi:hypothetical protein